MTEPSSRKEGFKKCRSATFSIDGYSFTIVANETGDKNTRPLSRFARSKSQNCLWNTIIGGLTGNLKERPKPTIISDPRPPEEILADELPPVDSPEALVKTSFRFDGDEFILFILERVSFEDEVYSVVWLRTIDSEGLSDAGYLWTE